MLFIFGYRHSEHIWKSLNWFRHKIGFTFDMKNHLNKICLQKGEISDVVMQLNVLFISWSNDK